LKGEKPKSVPYGQDKVVDGGGEGETAPAGD